MKRPVITLKPNSLATRLLLVDGYETALKAVLPPPSQAHPRAASALLEALSLWYQKPLYAVLCADEQGCSSALGLCDGFGEVFHQLWGHLVYRRVVEGEYGNVVLQVHLYRRVVCPHSRHLLHKR